MQTCVLFISFSVFHFCHETGEKRGLHCCCSSLLFYSIIRTWRPDDGCIAADCNSSVCTWSHPFVLLLPLLLHLLWILLDIIISANSGALHRCHYTPNDTPLGHRLFSVILVHEKDKFSAFVLSWTYTFGNLKTDLLTVFLIAEGSVSLVIQRLFCFLFVYHDEWESETIFCFKYFVCWRPRTTSTGLQGHRTRIFIHNLSAVSEQKVTSCKGSQCVCWLIELCYRVDFNREI